MTESHHGDVTVVEDVFEGALAVKLSVNGATLMVSDREARDALLCLADLFPSMLPVREPARLGASVVPPAPRLLPVKECCGAVIGEKCECVSVRMCQQCGFRKAQVFDIDGQWCGEECQRNDRVSEMRGWAR